MDLSGIDALSALLIAGGVVLFSLLVLAVVADRPRNPRPDVERLRAAAEELEAYAVATQTDAGRAAAIAGAARVAVAEAERHRDEAWADQEAAGQQYDRAWQAVLAGRQAAASAPVRDPEPDPERDRAVSRAALAAYRRGDLSLPQLREVFRRSGNWDPAQEERERVLDLARMRLAEARRAYDRAAALTRRVEQEARAAETAAWELLSEANRSVAEAREAYHTVQRFAQRRGRSRRRRKRAG
ncbi:hypothetical protein GCM10022225_42950 [Plantactinospora mayteni]|uniref:Uncharacterized protein n=1 Tax=Plantactinospora mayteni TaxID=566021 RepID=A0ABQ4ES51_9ACTN|nr:hypothetical protein [Plantactinospora mayteni]GIG97494.1 hypothetical protein Pma05_40670 [Plantactinospora mayteni]